MTYLDRQARVRGSCARDLPVVTVVGQSERLVVSVLDFRLNSLSLSILL